MSGDVDVMIERAFELLEEGNSEEALALGRELEEARHTSGFEIQALAHGDLGDLPEAIQILERGVELAPEVWLLWQLLGNYRSDEGLWEEALEAYERALRCPGVDGRSVHYNVATLLSRENRDEEALSHLQLEHLGAEEPRLELVCLMASLRIALLTRLEWFDEALAEGRRFLTKARVEDWVDEHLAPVLGEYASALWQGRSDREGAENAAWEAIALDKMEGAAMWVLRELNPVASSRGHLFWLKLEGRGSEPLEGDQTPPGFFTTYEVVADSADEALEFARLFEPPGVRDSLRIEESEVLEERPGEPKGVYRSSGYSFFPGGEFVERTD